MNVSKKKIKVLFVFGTRPEAIKMAPVIKECQKNKSKFKSIVCVTAQHRQMLDQVLNLFSIKPDYDLNIMTKKQSLPKLNAKMLVGVSDVIEKSGPDIMVVQGDTTTTYAAAQAAFYAKVPVAHIEAGLRTYDKGSPFPEEVNRCLTSVLSEIHLAPTEMARKNLLRENYDNSSVFVVGNTVIDALKSVQIKHKKLNIKSKWERWFLKNFDFDLSKKSTTILVTGHRRESFGKGFMNICKALGDLAKNNKHIQIIYPVHLNPNVQKPAYEILGDVANIHLISPLDYEPFVFLMNRAKLILTDSGGVQEEGPSFGIPVLVMRDTSERMEGVKAGSAKLVGTHAKSITSQVQKLLDNSIEYKKMSKVVNPYGDGKASQRIMKIIDGYFRRKKHDK
ncbi:MAG: UDP-N-acetylglucosamine 2-epimerase (non-hydrolyzing) [Candidatus Aceula meridiana]|nr:UDP-N-acetylglucosamine 2-epimerase (non-hydrolyzing) [Candidatus Aceula meridiana]